nr:hypothetical protein [Mycolicibacterium sp. P1-18]
MALIEQVHRVADGVAGDAQVVGYSRLGLEPAASWVTSGVGVA